ncbi:MAG: PASTA domain-containing protein [Bacteroidia bacterium]|nr:PASTA domain-containing protein [Bacteroidia bacterium]
MKTAIYIALILVIVGLIVLAIIVLTRKKNVKTGILVRFGFVFIVVLALFGVVFGRIIYLQNVEGDALRKLAEKRISEPDTIKAKRGNILSDDGRLMASSIPTYYLYMDMRVEALKVIKKGDTKNYFQLHVSELANALAKKFRDKTAKEYERDLTKAYKKKLAQYRIYPKRVSYLDYMEIKNFPILRRGSVQGGFFTEERVTRVKPFGSLASRTIGDIYGIEEKGGKNGLEMQYDSILRGTEGLKVTRKMAGKRTDIILKAPINGIDVVSTINIDLQEVAEKSLRNELTECQASCGTVILMDVKTGAVKAISNLTRNANGTYSEITNIAVASQIEPGSTFKTLSLLVALEDGVIDTTTMVNTENGGHQFANRIMKDWNFHSGKGGFGVISVPTVLHLSSNVGVSLLIDNNYRNNPQRFVDGIHRTKFDSPIKLELPGHGKVVIKDTDNKTWSNTTLPWMSIGYEVIVPPIYTLMLYNAIANDGKMMKPRFTYGLRQNGSVVEEFQPEVINESICSKETLGKVQAMLKGVVSKGTAKSVQSKLFTTAGKTGTAQIFLQGTNKNAEGRTRHQITFCGYFPADKPIYSCIVYIREPQGYASAGGMCGKVFKEVAEKAFILGGGDLPIWAKDSSSVDMTIDKVIAKEKIKPATTDDNIMPNVLGLTASDAMYILENKNVRVCLNGYGYVTSQSIPTGTEIKKGMTVILTLN